MTVPSEDSILRVLLVISWVGAANSAASPAQRKRLKRTIEVLRDDSYTAGEAYKKVILDTAEIMGRDWRPEGEWDSWITALLKEHDEQVADR